MQSVNVQIKSIELIENRPFTGQLPQAILDFVPIPEKDKGLFTIKWVFQLNIENNTYIVHKSKTVFSVDGLTLDNLTPNDPRVDLLAQMGQIAMAHSRLMFINFNKERTKQIPLTFWRHELENAMILKIKALSN